GQRDSGSGPDFLLAPAPRHLGALLAQGGTRSLGQAGNRPLLACRFRRLLDVAPRGGALLSAGHGQPRRLKNCTARSCFSAAARVLNVPRLRRRPVFGLSFLEYSRYSPEASLRIMPRRSKRRASYGLGAPLGGSPRIE